MNCKEKVSTCVDELKRTPPERKKIKYIQCRNLLLGCRNELDDATFDQLRVRNYFAYTEQPPQPPKPRLGEGMHKETGYV